MLALIIIIIGVLALVEIGERLAHRRFLKIREG